MKIITSDKNEKYLRHCFQSSIKISTKQEQSSVDEC